MAPRYTGWNGYAIPGIDLNPVGGKADEFAWNGIARYARDGSTAPEALPNDG